MFTGHTVTANFELPTCHAWSAEDPHRYTVTCELLAPTGEVAETAEVHVGCRRVEVRDRQLLVNGQPIWVFGVNRHDHHPDRGKALTTDDLRADLVAMRAHNITAVRTSHYPNDSAFYDLCDELGMYVIDEANIESHAYNTSLCHDPRYRAAFVERGARMVQRDRNHPSIIAWSLGNESGYGANHDALAAWIRRADPTRPLHYEGAVFHGDGTVPPPDRLVMNPNWVDGGLHASDLVCPMYPGIEAIREYGASGVGSRPLIMCEYSHAMGNSNGSLADYWDVITSTPGLQGGFIWEWKDHGLRQKLADGTTRLAYGGDFDDKPNDGNFVADGLMSADLAPHPAMREVAWVYRPVTVSLAGSGARRRLVVGNRRSFTDLRDLVATWELLVDGEVVGKGRLALPAVGPHSEVHVPLPCTVPARGEAFLSVRWTQRRASWFAPAGHLVAWDQMELRSGACGRGFASDWGVVGGGSGVGPGKPGRTSPAGRAGAALHLARRHRQRRLQADARAGRAVVGIGGDGLAEVGARRAAVAGRRRTRAALRGADGGRGRVGAVPPLRRGPRGAGRPAASGRAVRPARHLRPRALVRARAARELPRPQPWRDGGRVGRGAG